MNISMPTVSVIMPVYNGERFLAEAMESVLNQTYTDWELLVIDDGSTDDSVNVAAGYRDARIRVLANEGNRGLVYTRNRGLAEARGRYIAFLDADDVARPQRLKKQFDYLSRHSDIGGVGGWVQPINTRGESFPYRWKLYGTPDLTQSILLFRGHFNTSAFTVRKEFAMATGFRKEIPLAEDYDFYVRLARVTRLYNLPEVLTSCRIHDANTTKRNRTSLRACLDRLTVDQLSGLSIPPSTRELEVHRHLEWLDQPATPALLDEVEAWLVRILEANRQFREFPDHSLAIAAAERWFRVCEQAATLGVAGALLRCYASRLARPLREPLIDQTKFVAKCVLRRGPRATFA